MRTGSVKKYVIPNIPYLFVLWACLKLGTAYRLAAGADFPHKLMGLGQTVGPAFANLAPGLDPFDWLVGIVGAVGFRLLIYFKSKNAKKFRRDEEFGSARWGGPKDIAPFVDPVFENNVILTGTEFLTMNTRPKNPANARNLNACVIGSSGSGKTRFWLTPQLLQASAKKKVGCSFVVVDPKGGVLSQVGAFLQRRGYRIKVFNSIDFSQSMHYNPLAYIRNEADILKFVDTLIANTKGEGKEGDPFWTKAETLLYCALIAYIIFEGPAEDRNMNTLVDMISGMEVKEDNENFMNAVDYMFKGLEKRKPDCFAVKQYKKYKLASGVVCSKRLLNQAVGKSLRTHNLKPKKGAQVMRKNEKITALYERLSRDDFGKDDDQQRESNSISNQKAMLEEFAARQGFTNIVHFTDDGISGTCFDRPGFLAMMKEVEAGNVEYLCTLPLRWLPPATPLWTCRPETPCAASCSRSASLFKSNHNYIFQDYFQTVSLHGVVYRTLFYHLCRSPLALHSEKGTGGGGKPLPHHEHIGAMRVACGRPCGQGQRAFFVGHIPAAPGGPAADPGVGLHL